MCETKTTFLIKMAIYITGYSYYLSGLELFDEIVTTEKNIF